MVAFASGSLSLRTLLLAVGAVSVGDGRDGSSSSWGESMSSTSNRESADAAALAVLRVGFGASVLDWCSPFVAVLFASEVLAHR